MFDKTMDEALEVNPTVALTENQLTLAKVQQLDVGTEFLMTCKAVCVELHEANSENGMPNNTAILELSRVSLQTGEEKPAPSRVQSLYPNSRMAGNA